MVLRGDLHASWLAVSRETKIPFSDHRRARISFLKWDKNDDVNWSGAIRWPIGVTEAKENPIRICLQMRFVFAKDTRGHDLSIL
jgi:hypothetical protein